MIAPLPSRSPRRFECLQGRNNKFGVGVTLALGQAHTPAKASGRYAMHKCNPNVKLMFAALGDIRNLLAQSYERDDWNFEAHVDKGK